MPILLPFLSAVPPEAFWLLPLLGPGELSVLIGCDPLPERAAVPVTLFVPPATAVSLALAAASPLAAAVGAAATSVP